MNPAEVSEAKNRPVYLNIVANACAFQVDSLEQVAFQVLRLVRSIQNSFTPVSRIPPEVLSLIPDFYGYRADRDSIVLTHVCRSWRNTFIPRSSLWTWLDFTNIDKTRTYIQRSQSSPLEVYIGDNAIDDASALIIPHIHRLKSLTISTEVLPRVFEHFRGHTPLLEKMDIDIYSNVNPVPDNTFLDGNLSSLRELRLCKDITYFSWKDLANLRVVNLQNPYPQFTVTRLLDFFESAPLLHTVELYNPTERSTDAHPERIVPLRHLKALTIEDPPHSIVLHHLHIPVGASLVLKYDYSTGPEPPLVYYQKSSNPNYLSHITAINLLFDYTRLSMQLSGPSGSLRVLLSWPRFSEVPYRGQYLLFSCYDPIISTIERLAVRGYNPSRPPLSKSGPIFRILSSANHLRTLILTDCDHTPFISALDPAQNPSNLVPCPHLEEFVLSAEYLSLSGVEHLIEMAKNRALRAAKLSSITFVNLRGREQRDEAAKLRDHVIHVEYRTQGAGPAWDYVPGESGGEGV